MIIIIIIICYFFLLLSFLLFLLLLLFSLLFCFVVTFVELLLQFFFLFFFLFFLLLLLSLRGWDHCWHGQDVIPQPTRASDAEAGPLETGHRNQMDVSKWPFSWGHIARNRKQDYQDLSLSICTYIYICIPIIRIYIFQSIWWLRGSSEGSYGQVYSILNGEPVGATNRVSQLCRDNLFRVVATWRLCRDKDDKPWNGTSSHIYLAGRWSWITSFSTHFASWYPGTMLQSSMIYNDLMGLSWILVDTTISRGSKSFPALTGTEK